MNIDIIILNYNGEKLMPQCLPSLIEARKNSRHTVRIVVVDNESADSSLKVLEMFRNDVVVVKHKNRFLCSFNDVAAGLTSDVVILLNNDVKANPGFIDPLAEVFLKRSNTFLVAPKVLTFEGKEENGATIARLKLGLFWSSASCRIHEGSMNRFSHTFSSGFGAFDRRKFVQLGGYDNLYLPGRFEDADLCLRAWRMGWVSFYEPDSVVYHMGQVAFKERFGISGINAIDGKNIFLFMWKNYDPPLLAIHIIFLPAWLMKWFIKGSFYYISGLFGALKEFRRILQKRVAEKDVPYKITTAEAFRRLESSATAGCREEAQDLKRERVNLTIGIIAKNEERNVRDCILSVKEIASEIVIIDDFSSDGTERIAEEQGALVYKKKLDSFAAQKNYLISKCTHEWVLILDADERLEDALKYSIRTAIENSLCDAFLISRKNFIFGKHLKHGASGGDHVLRLFRKGNTSFVNDVHEEARVSGTIGRLSGGVILHYSTPDFSSYVRKLNHYTDIEVGMIRGRRKFVLFRLLAQPPAEFIWRYIFRLGFLDGIEGFLYAALCSVYTFVKYAKAVT